MKTFVLSITFGLWQICTSSTLLNSKKKCIAVPCGKGPDATVDCVKLLAGRTLLISTCFLAAISASSFFLIALRNEKLHRRSLVLSTVKVLAFTSLLMGITTISIIIYTTANVQLYLDMSLDACAYLGVIALIIHLIAAVVALLIK